MKPTKNINLLKLTHTIFSKLLKYEKCGCLYFNVTQKFKLYLYKRSFYLAFCKKLNLYICIGRWCNNTICNYSLEYMEEHPGLPV